MSFSPPPLLYFAWRYLAYHRLKTAVLIVAITLTIYLPLALSFLVDVASVQLMERARSTPIVIGSRNASTNLVLNTLYFRGTQTHTLPFGTYEDLTAKHQSLLIPLHTRFTAQDIPIIGTTPEYYTFRNLQVRTGRPVVFIGECVLGADAARELDVHVGDQVQSTPEILLDLTGTYPLSLKVVGILASTGTPDDGALFTDVKTSWLIEGIGHGHRDVSEASDTELIDREKRVANSALRQYDSINEETLSRFHFHGSPRDFPISAIIAVPPTEKAGVLLEGEFTRPQHPQHALRPITVMEELLGTLLRFEAFLNIAMALIGLATSGLAILVFMLSIRARQKEIDTLIKIGASPTRGTSLLALEILIVLGTSLVLAFLAASATSTFSLPILEALFL